MRGKRGRRPKQLLAAAPVISPFYSSVALQLPSVVFEEGAANADEEAPSEDEHAGIAIPSEIQHHVVKGTISAFGENGQLQNFRKPCHGEPCRYADEEGDEFAFRALGEEGVIGECGEDAENDKRTEMSERLSHPKGKIVKLFVERGIGDGQFKFFRNGFFVVGGGDSDGRLADAHPFDRAVRGNACNVRVGGRERHFKHRCVLVQRRRERRRMFDDDGVAVVRFREVFHFQSDGFGKDFLDGDFHAVFNGVGCGFCRNGRFACRKIGDFAALIDGCHLGVGARPNEAPIRRVGRGNGGGDTLAFAYVADAVVGKLDARDGHWRNDGLFFYGDGDGTRQIFVDFRGCGDCRRTDGNAFHLPGSIDGCNARVRGRPSDSPFGCVGGGVRNV